MIRTTGTYRAIRVAGEEVRAFEPRPLPPRNPPLKIEGDLRVRFDEAMVAVGRLSVAAGMVPSTDWFLYGFVRKEAVITSQIEGTQATLRDVLIFEATHQTDQPEDVREVCNYIAALAYARDQISRRKGLPISTRLLCEAHKRLMKGVRGERQQPGRFRQSQNWIGGTRPGNAVFVPPPPAAVPEAMSALEQWIHQDDPLPPLVRAGLAHVQFETIHPFLDGNGRIGRLLIALLLEHWRLLSPPVLYLSLAFKRNQMEYYRRLSEVRMSGDWEGWTTFYLECVRDAAQDGVAAAQRLHSLVSADRAALLDHAAATATASRLLEQLPLHPIITLRTVTRLLQTSKPTAAKAIDLLVELDVLRETTGRQRDRVYAYHRYLHVLAEEA